MCRTTRRLGSACGRRLPSVYPARTDLCETQIVNLRIITASVGVLWAAIGSSGAGEQSREPELSACQLMSEWKIHTGRKVKVRVIYTDEMVPERLYDPSCGQRGEVAVEWPPRLSRALGRR
jgi:hypothetical protein